MAASPENFKGKIVASARLTAPDGQADKLAALLKKMRAHCTSDADPGCIAFRVCRSGNDFFVFEEYQDLAATIAHRDHPKFQELFAEATANNLLTGAPKLEFYEEV